MNNKKSTGAYYTPDYLAEFIYSRLEKNIKSLKKLSILEPSVGDGSFLNALINKQIQNGRNISLSAIDNNISEISKLKKRTFKNIKIKFIYKDYLRYKPNSNELFSLVIGNPPYIRKRLLSKNQIKFGNSIHKQAELSEKTFKNIWSVFLIKSIKLLNKNGILAFILPAEILQVKYANELRDYILRTFKRTEIYTFSDLMFECKGQNTIVLIGYKKHLEGGVHYIHITDIKQVKNDNIPLIKNETIQALDIKWIHHTLDSDDLKFLNNIKETQKCVDDMCASKPGIVTAANSFFIIDSNTEEEYKWARYTKPILQKGSFVQTGIVFKKTDYNKLIEEGKPIKIICINNKSIKSLNKKNIEYLLTGKEMNIPDRYKCKIRDHWTIIPNISEPCEGFYFKRSHLFPKLIKNVANVLVTDTAYNILMRNNYDINSFIYSFYNSLTLVFSELSGRYYGGGVLELTPNEFKGLPIPYFGITNKEFNELSYKFKNGNDIKDILNYTDFILLPKIGLNREQILKIQYIRDLLSLKRRRLINNSSINIL